MSLNVKVKRTGRVQQPKLDNAQLTAIGRRMVAVQKERWARGINANGQTARPLSKRYTFIKKKFTGVNRPRRDMKMTGMTLQNFQLRKAINGVIRAEPSARQPRYRARIAQKYEDMIGFAGSDVKTVADEAQRQYGKRLRKMWVPIG